jgi:3-methylfumaryl-CoA hydratase
MSDIQDWIGRSSQRTETICDRQLALFRATLAGFLAPGDVPPGFHWTLVPDLAEPDGLGRDGHPRPGIFLPALPLPRRMWAGGQLDFHAPLAPGETVTRNSTITDIKFKSGASGQLGFVTVNHDWSVGDMLRISERQDIVYREDPGPQTARAVPEPAEPWTTIRSLSITPDPVLLFRYSALTFNGHRIHYDQPYATAVEGYDGLVVHGPLQALLMLNLATTILGRSPASFRYRGLSPLIAGQPARIEAREEPDGLALRVRIENGAATMSATASGA